MKRKLTFYLSSFNRGGAEWVVTNLVNSMVHNDIEVSLLTVRNGEMLSELDKKAEARHFNGSYFKSFLCLFILLRKNEGCVLLTTQRGASVLAFLIKKLSFTKVKHVVREAASNFEFAFDNKSCLKKRFWKYIYRLSYKNAYRIIVNSAGTRRDLETAGILKRNCTNVFQINNPLDIHAVRNRAELNDYRGLSFDRTTIVSIGRLVPKKNMDILIKAFHKIKKYIAPSQLIIIGDGPEKDRLEKLSLDLGLIDEIFFTGKIPNPYPLLKKADLFILASKWEGFGQVITEALALGVPVVATNIQDGPTHILNNGQYGELVEVDSIDDLASGMLKSLNSLHDKEKLKRRAEMFDKKFISLEYEKVIFG